MFRIRTKVFLGFVLLLAGCNQSQRVMDETAKNLRLTIENPKRPSFVSRDEQSRKIWDWTKQVYSARQFRPAWAVPHRVFAPANELLQTLDNAPTEGIDLDDTAALHTLRDAVDATTDSSKMLDFDLHMTYSFVKYVSQLCFGRVRSQDVDPNWRSTPKNCDVSHIVSDAIDKGQIAQIPAQLAPPLPEYKVLKETLRRYRESGGPSADTVPVEKRIEQIEINLDRLRWVTNPFERQYIRVNVPAFELAVHDGDQVPLQMRVIVGSDDNRTPIFSGEMQYIVFSPYWNIPLSIAKKELLPKIKKDPSYLDRQQIEVVRTSGKSVKTIDPSEVDWDQAPNDFDYQLRQKPGVSNSLGLVKFIFPNPFNVYLHDTPADNLFGRLTRTLSHGCIRLERPAELAEYVLKDQPEWTSERIATAMHAREEKHVPLKTRIPVHIVYWTAWVDSGGVVQFSKDVYGYDEKHQALVERVGE